MDLKSAEPRAFLRARWLDLLMLNYVVDPALLRPHVPLGTELDLWRGDALVSLVGIRFVDTRMLGVAFPGHRDFDEVNLRFYVRREVDGDCRRAVVFLREVVPRRAIAWTARALYNEPYVARPMRHAIAENGVERRLRYEWQERSTWVGLEATTTGDPAPFVSGSQAEFITEHFWGYTRQRDGGTIEYHVAHPSWRVWETTSARAIGPLTETYGAGLAAILEGTPRSSFVAEGSDVVVFRPSRVET